jgi:preprotein translocase subunit SecD
VTVRVGADPDIDGLRLLASPGQLSFRAILAGPSGSGPQPPVGTALAGALTPFQALTPDEVAELPVGVQFAEPLITCAALDARPPSADDPGAPLAACQPGAGKYLLAPAAVTGADTTRVSAYLDAALGWSVRLAFSTAGQARWTELTEAPAQSGYAGKVAVVVDGRIVATPRIERAAASDVLVPQPGMDQHRAARLAALLGTGPLPASFTVLSIDLARTEH